MLRVPFLVPFVAAATLIASSGPAARSPTPQTPRRSNASVVTAISAPAGTEALDVQWLNIAVPYLGTIRAAVARPSGAGPFPTLVLLHGTHGFAREYVQIARALANEGLLAVAACWFSRGEGPGVRFVTPIACPDAPKLAGASSPVAMQTVDALVNATRTLPDVRADRIALFGHSRGAGATLNYVLTAKRVQAAVLNSGGYPPELADRIGWIEVPILILHGVADGPDDGGSAMTNVDMARRFEAALRHANKVVEAHYYDGAGHNGLFSNPAQRDDEIRRMAAFLRRHLAG
jgi:carboxymethylenebutenolidase